MEKTLRLNLATRVDVLSGVVGCAFWSRGVKLERPWADHSAMSVAVLLRRPRNLCVFQLAILRGLIKIPLPRIINAGLVDGCRQLMTLETCPPSRVGGLAQSVRRTASMFTFRLHRKLWLKQNLSSSRKLMAVDGGLAHGPFVEGRESQDTRTPCNASSPRKSRQTMKCSTRAAM